jgi:hypothetical protein
MGVFWFRSYIKKIWLHVEDLSWPRKSSGKSITAKNTAVDFALAFADNVRLSVAKFAIAA